MLAPSANTAACANAPSGQLAGNAVSFGRTCEGLRKLFRKLWPTKTAVELAYRTESNLRHAERMLAGQRGLSGETIHALLHTDEGWAVLEELMRGCRAPWWRDMQRTHAIADLLRRQEENRRLLESLQQQAAD